MNQDNATHQSKDTLFLEHLHLTISEAAYYLAEHRGFQGGDPVSDWLEAEFQIVNAPLTGKPNPEKEVFQEKYIRHLDDASAILNNLKIKAKKAKADIRHNAEIQMEDVRTRHASLNKKIHELRNDGESAWEDLKSTIEKSWVEMQNTINNIADHFK